MCCIAEKDNTLMYKNIICFVSLLFITQNVLMGRIRERERERKRERWGEASGLHTQGPKNESSVNSFYSLLGSKSSWLYNIPDAYTRSRGSHLLKSAACTLHMDTPTYSMPPTQFTQRSSRSHLRPVYFRCQALFLLFLFPESDFRSCIYRYQRGQVHIQLKLPIFTANQLLFGYLMQKTVFMQLYGFK